MIRTSSVASASAEPAPRRSWPKAAPPSPSLGIIGDSSRSEQGRRVEIRAFPPCRGDAVMPVLARDSASAAPCRWEFIRRLPSAGFNSLVPAILCRPGGHRCPFPPSQIAGFRYHNEEICRASKGLKIIYFVGGVIHVRSVSSLSCPPNQGLRAGPATMAQDSWPWPGGQVPCC